MPTQDSPSSQGWKSISVQPKPGTYLVSANYGGIATYDVAYYNGRRKDGSHWWTMADIEIDQKTIEFYAEIISPPDKTGSQ
jgi:hypothetical protein